MKPIKVEKPKSLHNVTPQPHGTPPLTEEQGNATVARIAEVLPLMTWQEADVPKGTPPRPAHILPIYQGTYKGEDGTWTFITACWFTEPMSKKVYHFDGSASWKERGLVIRCPREQSEQAYRLALAALKVTDGPPSKEAESPPYRDTLDE